MGTIRGANKSVLRVHLYGCVRKKGFAFAVREGCGELASVVGRVSERTRFKRSSRPIRARPRALHSIALVVDLGKFGFGRE